MGRGRCKSGIRKNYRDYLSVISSHSLILFLLGLIAVIYFNAVQASKDVYESIGMTLLISDDIPDDQLEETVADWQNMETINSAEIISRERAAESIKSTFGNDAFDVIGYNPMKRMVDVSLTAKFARKGDIESLKEQLEGYSFVQKIHYKEDMLDSIRSNLKNLYFLSLVVMAIFVIVFISLMRSTIQNSLDSKKALIKNMRLVGASSSFIRKPFMSEAFWIGFIGSTISLILLSIFIGGVHKYLYTSLDLGTVIEKVILLMGIYTVGIGLSLITTRAKLYAFMRVNENEVYF
ncbi:permease-like cell division protein FtsX [Halosquirtibacter xylanolyticus]|uniref:cell division protein FtsX n=1 Tax=Halosquirtibacter xylanolyticus TaxID=3374599 RepID=UPI0037484EA9|nr:permease-like cell division protein FtsX [Prolixibacteraceae bacterium]